MPTPAIDWYNADGLRWCSGCATYMSAEQFHRNRSSVSGDGLQTYCRLCAREVRRRTYQRHRDREIARSRARIAAALADPAQRERIQAQRRLASRVWYLRQQLAAESGERMEAAHV